MSDRELPPETEHVLLLESWVEPLADDDDRRPWSERHHRGRREIPVEVAEKHWDALCDQAIAIGPDDEPIETHEEQLAEAVEGTVLGAKTVSAAMSLWRASQ